MLLKRNRADRKQIEQIFKSGGFLSSPNLSFKFILPKNNPTLDVDKSDTKILLTKISFIVPKTISKKAVKRNLLRRLGYEALKPYLGKLPVDTTGAFIFKKNMDNKEAISNEIQNIIKKIQY